MGAAAASLPRAVLETPVQMHFKALNVKAEVADILQAWFDNGAPLGLSAAEFAQILELNDDVAKGYFDIFDTDKNRKVDALEALSTAVVLASGAVDDKLEAAFSIFDFAGKRELNFDEASIFLHSVTRGLQKVCGTPPVLNSDLMGACQSMFDAHNLPNDRCLSREQMRRWLRSDREAMSYLDAFHRSHALPLIEEHLGELERTQADAYSLLQQQAPSSSGGATRAESIHQSSEMRRALGGPPEEVFQTLLASMAARSSEVAMRGFAQAARAWNIFSVVTDAGESSASAKEVAFMLRLWRREAPSPEDLAALRASLALSPLSSPSPAGDDLAEAVTLEAWLGATVGDQ